MRAEVGVLVKTEHDRDWLVRIRQWVVKNNSSLNQLGLSPNVKSLIAPEQAWSWRAEAPDERVVVVIGYSREEIAALQAFVPGEPIIVQDANAPGLAATAAACTKGKRSVAVRGDITPQLRKSLIRIALDQRRIQIRAPESDAELSGYFSLRYKVWKAMGYLREENRQTRANWEIDFWDRTATPLCAVSADGKVVGCMRLISNLGIENPAYVAKIDNLLTRIDDEKLRNLFRFQHIQMHPFDVLFEFPGFWPKFKALLQSRQTMAEVGRVAVDPDYRGHCISEALVDTAVSLAESRRVSWLFLACHEELGGLYEKCGFARVPDLRSEKFFNIELPSIVMERRL